MEDEDMIVLLSSALAQVTGGAPPATNGQLFRPTIDGTHTLWADDTARAPDGWFGARGLFQYVRDPVIWTGSESGDVKRVVGDLFQLDLLAGYTKGPVRFGVDVPIFLRSVGDDGGESGLGDVALDVKASLLDRTDTSVGFALGGRMALPTATVDGPLGNRGFAWELSGIVDGEAGGALLTANLGVRGVPREALENFDWGTQLVLRAGTGYPVASQAGISFDVGAHLNLVQPVLEATPIEGIVGGWFSTGDLIVRGGVGTGFTSGFGSPQVRALLSVGYEPPRARDTDADGVLDTEDSCIEEPEDLDGFEDDDGCPEPTRVLVRVQADGQDLEGATFTVGGPAQAAGQSGQELTLDEGTYSIDLVAPDHIPLTGQVLTVPDGAGHTAVFTLERAVKPAELTVRILDPEGQPVEGASWSVRNDESGPHEGGGMHSYPPGSYQVRASAQGYYPRGLEVELADGAVETLDIQLTPARVRITKEKIDIRESIYFETGKDVIKPESFGLLDEVSAVINDHPEILRIRVEGHTDSRGSASRNLDLSTRRAKSVLDYLVGKGVVAERLESEGFGESKPIAEGNTEEAWSKNRRVDFFVAERAEEDDESKEE